MQGIINVNGYIGSFPDEKGNEIKGIELVDVISQVHAQPDAESLLVKINSKGGSVNVGFDIYDYLRTLGKPIHTEATGFCSSMATIIFLAGETRAAVEPLEFLPHNPWTSNVSGDADDILAAAAEMRAVEDRIIKFYSDITGVSKQGIDSLMKLDRPLPLDKAVELKFITEIRPQLKTVAVYKTNNDMNLIQELNKKIDALMKAVKPEIKAVGMKATTLEGVEVEILNQDGSEVTEPAVSNMVMIEGAPAPDGTYKFEGYTAEVLLGVITAIMKDEAAAEEEMAAEPNAKLVEENESLKKENEEMKVQIEALGAKFDNLTKAVGMIKSSYVAPDEKTVFAMKTKKELEDVISATKERSKMYKKNK